MAALSLHGGNCPALRTEAGALLLDVSILPIILSAIIEILLFHDHRYQPEALAITMRNLCRAVWRRFLQKYLPVDTTRQCY
jgi:hypothetical protein